MTPLELPFEEQKPSELDQYLREIDRALDACFMGELEDALVRAAGAREPTTNAAVALV
jgi:hypothetical protein